MVTTHVKICRYLLDRGSVGISDAVDNHHATPLHYAAYNGNLKTLQYLLDGGADVYAVNKAEGKCMHVCLPKC